MKVIREKTFRELYEAELKKPTAAQTFVKQAAAVSHRSEATVRMWLSGNQMPDELAQNVLATKFGIKASVLFPRKEGGK